MPMPRQQPGQSRQDYQTPPEFLQAVRNLLGVSQFFFDLAASALNTAAFSYYDEATNGLIQPWDTLEGEWNWLNPPFANIRPWVQRACQQAGPDEQPHRVHNTAMLVPAAVGSNWWRDYVHLKAHVLLLNGRLTFVGASGPYPKDCALLLYGDPPCRPIAHSLTDYYVWDWRHSTELR